MQRKNLGKISRPQNKNNLKSSTSQNPGNNSETIKAGREYKVKKYNKIGYTQEAITHGT